MAPLQPWSTAVAPEDKTFYRALGQRIAQFRKAQNLTQTQLAEQLGISQQTLAHYEVGRLRVAVALLSPLAKALSVSVDDLLEDSPGTAPAKRGPASKLAQQVKSIRALPHTKQRFVMEMLDTVIQQQQASR